MIYKVSEEKSMNVPITVKIKVISTDNAPNRRSPLVYIK